MAINFPNNPLPDQIWTDPSNNNTYQYQIDPESPIGQQIGKWTTNIRRTSGDLNGQYLRIDGSNGPVQNNLGATGYIEFNAGTPRSFTSPFLRGDYGSSIISNGDGTTDWRPQGSNPGPTAPVDPFIGEFWYNTTDSTLYTWFDDGSGVDWIAVT